MLKENKEKEPNLKNNYIWLLFCIAAGVSNLIMEVPFTQEKDTRVSKNQHYTVYQSPKTCQNHRTTILEIFFFFWRGDYYKKNSQLISNSIPIFPKLLVSSTASLESEPISINAVFILYNIYLLETTCSRISLTKAAVKIPSPGDTLHGLAAVPPAVPAASRA